MDDKKLKQAIKRKRKKTNIITFQTHPVLLEKVHGNVRAMAVYHFYKSRYLNSTIYHFSYNKVAKDLNMSWRSAKKHIDFLIDNGWARHHKDNLTFVDIRRIGVEYKLHPKLYRTIKTTRKSSLQDIEDVLYTMSLNNYCMRQDYVQGVKHDRKLMQQSNAFIPYKRAKKIAKLNESGQYLGKCYDHVIISARNLGRKWNVSSSKAASIIRRLKSKHLISTQQVIDLVSKQFYGRVDEMDDVINIGFGHTFKVGSYLYLHRGTKLTSVSSTFYTRIEGWLSSSGINGNQIDCAKIAEA